MEHGKENGRLDQVLASYGADPLRWPEADRLALDTNAAGADREAREIDLVLGLASVPVAPRNAEARLLARLADMQSADVIPFRPQSNRGERLVRFSMAVPLAASLALGIYLGAAGALDAVLPATVTGSVATIDEDFDDLGGIGEAEAYAEENLT